MEDDKTTIKQLKEQVKKFHQERDWDKYHGAKELAVAAILEAAELLAPFRFKSSKEVEEIMDDPERSQAVKEELADMLNDIVTFAERYDIDLSKEFRLKLVKLAEKYPVEKARGSNKKYYEL